MMMWYTTWYRLLIFCLFVCLLILIVIILLQVCCLTICHTICHTDTKDILHCVAWQGLVHYLFHMNELKKFYWDDKICSTQMCVNVQTFTVIQLMIEFWGPHVTNMGFPSILWFYNMCTICGQSEWSDLTWTVKVLKKYPLTPVEYFTITTPMYIPEK